MQVFCSLFVHIVLNDWNRLMCHDIRMARFLQFSHGYEIVHQRVQVVCHCSFFLIVHLNFFLTHKSRKSAQFARSIVAMVMFLFAPDTGVGRNASLVPFHL